MSLAAMAGSALAQGSNCGDPFQNHYGPFDYRAHTPTERRMVEGAHFTPGVETLTKPSKTLFHQMAADVAYTLHVYPNHHRALITMANAAVRFKHDPAPGARYTVECYFDRAIRFRPDDTVARALYSQYLMSQKRPDDAARQLAIASEHAKDNPLSHFNIGLLYFEMGRYDLALSQAHTALALGYPRQELVDKLKALNRWTEPAAASSPALVPAPRSAAPAASAASDPH